MATIDVLTAKTSTPKAGKLNATLLQHAIGSSEMSQETIGAIIMKTMVLGVVLAVDAAAGALMTPGYQLGDHGLILASLIGGSFGLLSMWGLFGYGSGNEKTVTQLAKSISRQALASVPTAGMIGPWLTMVIHDWFDKEGPVRVVHAIAVSWFVGLAGPFIIRMYGRKFLELLPEIAQKLAKKWSAVFLVAIMVSTTAVAEVFYCDPVNGTTPTSPKDLNKGDGSKDKPWGSLESVIKARLVNGADSSKGKIHAGDTIKLMSGDHGRAVFQSPEYQCSEAITVEAEDGESPKLSQVSVKFARNWVFRGITIQCPSPTADTDYSDYMLFRGTDVSGFEIDQCRVQSTEDATVWGDREWETRCAWFGIWLSGKDLSVTNCNLYALENCIAIDSGSDIVVDGNDCDLFLNDGIQHCASNLRITSNNITNQYNLASNVFHHDGIQGWSLKGVHQKNVYIYNNFVARSTGKYKQVPPISSAVFQGISIFDGRFSEVTISNNIVMSSASHGIALYGCTDSTIERNTVIYQGMTPNKPCWIGVFVGKPKWGAIVPTNITVIDNIAPTYTTNASAGVKLGNNFAFKVPGKPWQASFTVVEPSKTFVRYEPSTANFDLSVRDDSPAAGKVIRVGGAGARR